jgi:hypothetical protein
LKNLIFSYENPYIISRKRALAGIAAGFNGLKTGGSRD